MPDEAELTHIAEDLRPLAVPIDSLVRRAYSWAM